MGVKLAVFDLDGTLIRGDTVCLAIARALGKYDRMLEFEGARYEDEVTAARREMADWYLAAGQCTLRASLGALRLAPGAVEGISSLKSAGIETIIVSITWGFGVEKVARRLGIEKYFATELDFDSGDVSHIYGRDKGRLLRSAMMERGLSPDEVAVVGDTLSDYPMLEEAAHRYFVGPNPPTLENCHHMPDADIRDIARSILEAR